MRPIGCRSAETLAPHNNSTTCRRIAERALVAWKFRSFDTIVLPFVVSSGAPLAGNGTQIAFV
tara:strand:- start:425 stop:613 length:189 start_codon:yes stop_codon:yes gene_type:complete